MKLIRIHCHTDLEEVVAECHLDYHPDLLAIYEEMGLIEREGTGMRYDDVQRLKKINRLKRNCGVNTVGASIIVDLLEKIENLQDEVERLRRK